MAREERGGVEEMTTATDIFTELTINKDLQLMVFLFFFLIIYWSLPIVWGWHKK